LVLGVTGARFFTFDALLAIASSVSLSVWNIVGV
jgi:hypothetical protein